MYGQDYGTPDCIVIIDSSGSMVEPQKNISHAVLGAACAAEADCGMGPAWRSITLTMQAPVMNTSCLTRLTEERYMAHSVVILAAARSYL